MIIKFEQKFYVVNLLILLLDFSIYVVKHAAAKISQRTKGVA